MLAPPPRPSLPRQALRPPCGDSSAGVRRAVRGTRWWHPGATSFSAEIAARCSSHSAGGSTAAPSLAAPLRTRCDDYCNHNTDCYRQSSGITRRSKRSMRQVHLAGEKLFLDYSGKTVPIIDAATGKLGASSWSTSSSSSFHKPNPQYCRFGSTVGHVDVASQFGRVVGTSRMFALDDNPAAYHMLTHISLTSFRLIPVLEWTGCANLRMPRC